MIQIHNQIRATTHDKYYQKLHNFYSNREIKKGCRNGMNIKNPNSRLLILSIPSSHRCVQHQNVFVVG